jgi:hypothetical protein
MHLGSSLISKNYSIVILAFYLPSAYRRRRDTGVRGPAREED